jgi:hypothetical protein
MRLVLIGIVSLLLAALGVRLLRISRRGGGTPERWLGTAFLSAGASAWLVPLAAREGLPTETARLIAFGAQGGMSVAIACLVRFTWVVFRPGASPARWLAPALIAANLAAFFAVVWSGMPVPVGRVGLGVLLARCTALFWLFLESTRYARRMRRRVRLGLADPIVANRFALWSIWTGALAGIPFFVLGLRVAGLLEAPVPGEPLPASLRATFAVLGAGCGVAVVACWLAFFPPDAYRRWLAKRAPAPR